eukprot:CAMPEP_0169101466 /NCGR_PEP_ID=MMETSP1015-20121227/21643_1 /TAXON_ID=342587 /ORGANISM="Karlodinium micrum, Strain CCMP2283" /LENGTH=178 /DNA_ID=CAMNT_0009162491 /DNA_START=61 /DNA_END=595 /DNA_ORIENTATION=-
MAVSRSILFLLATVADARTFQRAQGIVKYPPEPVGTMPEPAKDGAFSSKADACQACKFAATKSCAMYKTCICYATNAVFPIVGLPDPTDTTNFHWACGGEGGDKYELCFKVNELYEDPFGDKIDHDDKTCVCYAANAVFPIVGLPDPTDTTNFHWACGGEGGEKYELCFKVNELYEDP